MESVDGVPDSQEKKTKSQYRPLAKNMNVFLDSYVPEKLPHREMELQLLEQILQPLLFDNPVSNVIVMGKTGTGKTVVVKRIGQILEEKGKEQKLNLNFQYVNCSEIDNIHSLLSVVGNMLSEDPEMRIPYTGWPLDKVVSTFKEILSKKRLRLVIILDEIDKLIQKNGDSALYTLVTLSSDQSVFKLNLIGITNDVNLPSQISDERVKSRLNDEKVTFVPYNAEQLKTILEERVNLALGKDILDDDVIPVCAAIGAQEHGDARRAINLLRMSIQIAERKGLKKITVNEVYEAKGAIEAEYLDQILSGLPLHEKLILFAMVIFKERNVNKIQTTPEVIAVYNMLCKKATIAPLSPRRISDLVNDMATLGILNTNVKYYGKRGRIKEIELWVPLPNVMKMVETEKILSELAKSKSYPNLKQKTLL